MWDFLTVVALVVGGLAAWSMWLARRSSRRDDAEARAPRDDPKEAPHV